MNRFALRVTFASVCGVVLLISPNMLIGCGGDPGEAVYHYSYHPDVPLKPFAAGQLGIIRAGWRPSYLTIAYRYLSGLSLAPAEQAAIVNSLEHRMWKRADAEERREARQQDPLETWRAARQKVARAENVELNPQRMDPSSYAWWTNCNDDALRTAARTLDDRVARFGADNENVRDWLTGQNMVFLNCSGDDFKMPLPTMAGAPAWLRADRDYQMAAAAFYGRHYDEAFRRFQAIAADRESPWSNVAPYLAARALIRKGLEKYSTESDKSVVDVDSLHRAEAILATVLANPAMRQYHASAAGLIGYSRFRSAPKERLQELAAVIVRPHPGDAIGQDVIDYMLLLDNGVDATDDLTDWIHTLTGSVVGQEPGAAKQPQPNPAAIAGFQHAVSKWRASKSVPWLVAAVMLARAGAPEARELSDAAQRLPKTSPAYLTTRYYLIQSDIDAGHDAEARAALARLPEPESMPGSARNLFQQQREHTAESFAAFLRYSQIVPVSLVWDTPLWPDDAERDAPSKPLFDDYAAEILNERSSLRQLATAIEGNALEATLRKRVAYGAWTRAALIDAEQADSLAGLVSTLEPSLAPDLQRYREAKGADKHFAAVWTFLHNPGLRPYVEPGSNGRDPAQVHEMDHFRDNWWCEGMSAARDTRPADSRTPAPFPPFVSAADKTAATGEWERLSKIETGPNYLGRQVLAWAKQHPDDARIPEALHLVVNGTHYGCANDDTINVSRAAFDLLHRRYPKSEWTAKTRYYYGNKNF